ncbi:MAG: tetratricopeptide repeat protein [Isosphaeraceae bacterium]
MSKSRDVRAELTAESDSSTSARWSDLATSHQSIANLLWRTGRTAEALESDREALAIWQRLVTRDIEEAAFRYNLASCQSEIGLLLLLSEHPDAAIESLSDAISNFLLVVRTNPSVSAFQSGLGFAYVRIAQAYSSDGRLREALEPEHLAVEKFRKLADANPAVFDHKYYLALACNTLSETQAKLGQLSEAMETARQSTSVARDLVASNPERPRSHEVLAMALMAVGRIEQERKNWIDAAAAFREGISAYEEIPPSARYLETHYNLACGRSMLAYVLSRSDPTGTPEVQAVSDRAMASLRTAVSLGFQSTSSLRTDGDLTFIRPRPDFQLMLLDLDFPPEPFSP